MGVVVYVFGAAAMASWLVSAISAAELVTTHRTEGRSVASYAFNGYLFFSASNFAPEGAAAHGRFIKGVLGFMISVAGVGLSIVMLSATEGLVPG